MKHNLLLIVCFWLLSADVFAQATHTSKLSGVWINTQYDYYKNKPQYDKILYNISPWFINLDTSGKCTVILLFEQRTFLGYPISKKFRNGVWEYHYKKGYDVWLYSVANNDSLLIYSNGITPGAGIIFHKYTP